MQTRYEIASGEITNKAKTVATAMRASADCKAAKRDLEKSRRDAEYVYDQQQLQHAQAIAEKERIIVDKERRLVEKDAVLDKATKHAAKLQSDVTRLETALRAVQKNDDTELPKLMKESTHARKYAKIAFHPDKQPSATTRRIAEPYFKHASAADASRSSGNT